MNMTTLIGTRKFGLSALMRNAALLLSVAGLLFWAAPKAQADDEQQDPPTRVARISYIDGTVSMQPGGEGDWGNAAKNRPMTIGDKLWVDKDSRAELQAGQVAIHLGNMTALSFLNLDAGITQMRLAEGSINFRVRALQQGELCELDTPNLAFTVKQAGDFRIDVSENGDATRVTVVAGEGEVTAGTKTYPVHAGEQAEFTGTDNVQSNIQPAPAPDGLDRWAAERDAKEDNSVSAKYVSRDMDGYSDLDQNGSWNQEPDYGNVWYPNAVDPGWAPYSYGYWNWVGPWGWTWVDYSPWGFAPYHYGRWAYIGSRWGWCPGPYYGRPIYGPAFVGFVGGGFGFGVGIGVGWFPLGFGEPYHPWYHASNRYVTNVNIHNTTIHNVNVINNSRGYNYAYAHNANAVTATSRNTFVSGQAVNRGAARLTEASLKGVQVSNSASLTPTKQSYIGAANGGAHVSRPPANVQNRPVMARTSPANAASHLPVRTLNTTALTAGRTGNVSGTSSGTNSAMNLRQRELSQSRPASTVSGNARTTTGGTNNAPQQRSTTNGSAARVWAAQGNTTDHGKEPAGFGSSNRPSNSPSQTAQVNRTDRPPWAGSSQPGVNASTGGNRSYSPPQRTSPSYNNGGNSPQQRAYNPPPARSSPAPRTYSPPSRSYPAPSRSNSAPSRGSGGGGGSPHGSGGSGASHGGGGGGTPHGGGGGGAPHSGGGGSHGHR
jgi:hypothetical protein